MTSLLFGSESNEVLLGESGLLLRDRDLLLRLLDLLDLRNLMFLDGLLGVRSVSAVSRSSLLFWLLPINFIFQVSVLISFLLFPDKSELELVVVVHNDT